MGEETWPENVVRSKSVLDGRGDDWDDEHADNTAPVGVGYCDTGIAWGKILSEGPRPIICADCGTPIKDGLVVHMKPETYAILIRGEVFYIERHIGVSCGCAAKRGFA